VNFLHHERERERERERAGCRVQSKIDTRNTYGEKKGKEKKNLEFEKGVLLETL